MIDHIGLKVKDIELSKNFYQKALAPLGYELKYEFKKSAGFSCDNKVDFWIEQKDPVSVLVHVAFKSTDRETVRKFYDAALAAGGKDNGAPGLRPDYHANYYAAFVYDPDGNNIEAVNHKPE